MQAIWLVVAIAMLLFVIYAFLVERARILGQLG